MNLSRNSSNQQTQTRSELNLLDSDSAWKILVFHLHINYTGTKLIYIDMCVQSCNMQNISKYKMFQRKIHRCGEYYFEKKRKILVQAAPFCTKLIIFSLSTWSFKIRDLKFTILLIFFWIDDPCYTAMIG